MERIEIEIDNETAKKWKAASPEVRSSTMQSINSMLKHALEPDGEELIRYTKALRQKTADRGLTPEVFQEIMELDDETMKNLMGEDYQTD